MGDLNGNQVAQRWLETLRGHNARIIPDSATQPFGCPGEKAG